MTDLLEVTYMQGASSPDLWAEWLDANKKLIPFETEPHTFRLWVENRKRPGTTVFTKTSGITGFDTNPNIAASWAVGQELSQLTPGIYNGIIEATRSSDSKPRYLPFTLTVTRKPGGTVDPGPADPPA